MSTHQDAPGLALTARTRVGGGVGAQLSARTLCAPGRDDGSFHLARGLNLVAPGAPGRTPRNAKLHAHGFVPDTLVVAHSHGSRERSIVAAPPKHRRLTGAANGSVAQTMPFALDAESRAWWQRLHAPEPIRGWAIAESLRAVAA